MTITARCRRCRRCIPALLEQGTTKEAIAAMFGVTLGTLAVCCSRRGISLRKGARRTLVVPLSDDVLKSLRDAARSLRKGSAERLRNDAEKGRKLSSLGGRGGGVHPLVNPEHATQVCAAMHKAGLTE
jgi:hypothetical protein